MGIEKLMIIGIDSLDPYVLLKYRKELLTFSKLIQDSPTFISKSIFPPDSIPAWASIYTGLSPARHGVFYVFDVFDPNLSDLTKVEIKGIKGKTFWDYASQNGFRSVIMYPLMCYPPWEINGIMISKNPIDKRVDWIKTENSIGVYPEKIKQKYNIPSRLIGLWGGFPGEDRLKEWSELGKEILTNEKNIGLEICKNEKWDLFFIYFSILDIIQHRLWRFFDENDPLYPGPNNLGNIVVKYYTLFDTIIKEFMESCPDATIIVMSDHGHKSRPIKTVNINEYLRRKGFLIADKRKWVLAKLRKIILEITTKLGIEHWLIKIVSKNKRLTKTSKALYSSAGFIDTQKSIAYLSNFAGIKSYPHGGIVINQEVVSREEYDKIRNEIIYALQALKDSDGKPLFQWVKKREEVYNGEFLEKIYPDILFELRDEYGVGWEVFSDIYGKAHDHSVASGGHRKEGVFLVANLPNTTKIKKDEVSILDIAPTVLSLLGIDWRRYNFDGVSIVEKKN